MALQAEPLAFIATAAAVAVVARAARLPYATALVVAALGLGAVGRLPKLDLDPQVVLHLLLPILLFEAAISTSWGQLRANAAPVATLATVGILLMAALLAGALQALLAWPLGVAFLVGAILSISDTVAVLAVLKELKVPPRLAAMVEGESLFNDATGVLLVGVAMAHVAGQPLPLGEAIVNGAWLVLGGAALGGLAGLAGTWALSRTHDHLVELMITVLVALGGYEIAEKVHASGVLAVVVAGLVVGTYGWSRALNASSQIAMRSFWEQLGFAANTLAFLLVGLNLPSLGSMDWRGPAIAFGAMMLARAVVVVGLLGLLQALGQGRVPWRWQALLTWGSLRGSLSMVLAVALPLSLEGRDEVLGVVFGVVFMSLVIQGLTLRPLVAAWKLGSPSPIRAAFERAQLRIVGARAAQAELQQLHGAGLVSKLAFERLHARYQVSVAQAERELRSLGNQHPEAWDVALGKAEHRLLEAEKAAIQEALRRGLVGAEIASEQLGQLDERLAASPLAADPQAEQDLARRGQAHLNPGASEAPPS